MSHGRLFSFCLFTSLLSFSRWILSKGVGKEGGTENILPIGGLYEWVGGSVHIALIIAYFPYDGWMENEIKIAWTMTDYCMYLE